MNIPFWQVDMEPKALGKKLKKVVLDKSFSMGKFTENFESDVSKLLNVKHVVACTSGSDAILMALIAIGVKSGDVVALNDRSWIAAAHAINLLGAKILIVDILPNKPVFNLNDFKNRLETNIKAVLIVHMNGRTHDLNEIVTYCKSRDLPLIEDAAQGLGAWATNSDKGGGDNASKSYLGTLGDIGCFSLSTAKIIGSGQGGFCVTNDSRLYEKLTRIRLHGCDNVFDALWQTRGFNFRFTDLHAAIALHHLPYLDRRLAKIEEIYQTYQFFINEYKVKNLELIANIYKQGEYGPYMEFNLIESTDKPTLSYNKSIDSKFYIAEQRKNFIKKMRTIGIEIRPFYPPITSATYLEFCGPNKNLNAMKLANAGMYFPSGPSLNSDQIEYVIKSASEFF